MTFPNNDMNQGGQAVPAAPPPSSGGDDGGGGLRQWLIDSYNGLYKVVLEPSMPKIYQVLLIIFGAFLGLIWAWGLFPTQFTGANPNRLNEAAQDQWVRMVAVGTTENIRYPQEAVIELLSRIPSPEENIQRLINDPNTAPGDVSALQSLQALLPTEGISAAEAPSEGSFVAGLIQIIILILLIGIITPIFMLIWRLLIYPNIVGGIVDQFKQATNAEYKVQRDKEKANLAVAQQQRRMREEMQKQAASSDLGPSIMTQLAIYTPGRSFDESYEIELESGEFLGQSGAVIAEATDPDPVAIEVWLFDIFNSTESKKIFVTPQGNADPSIRSRLEGSVPNPATDIIVAQPGANVQLESDKIILQAKMASVDFNANGRFENFNMEMRAWQKGATGTAPPVQPTPPAQPMSTAQPPLPQATPPPAAAGRPMSDYNDIQFDPPPQMPSSGASGRPMSDYEDIQFDPPPQMPSGPSQPSAPSFQQPPPPSGGTRPPTPLGGQRLTPPPLSFPDSDDDDDPFGGTGDFTPLGNEPRR